MANRQIYFAGVRSKIKNALRERYVLRYKIEVEIRRSRTYVIYHKRVLCVCIAIQKNIEIFEKCLFREKKNFASESHVKDVLF